MAEDRGDLRDAMADSLTNAGYDVVACQGVREGLQRLEEGPFALLCTDAIMEDGATEWLISAFEEQYPKAVVLVCTGHVSDELVRRGIEAGRYALLQKPFDGPGLVRAVDDALQR